MKMAITRKYRRYVEPRDIAAPICLCSYPRREALEECVASTGQTLPRIYRGALRPELWPVSSPCKV